MNLSRQGPEQGDRHSLDALAAELAELMTRYSFSPCAPVAIAIAECLARLCEHRDIELVPEQRVAYARLLNGWRMRACVDAGRCAERVH